MPLYVIQTRYHCWMSSLKLFFASSDECETFYLPYNDKKKLLKVAIVSASSLKRLALRITYLTLHFWKHLIQNILTYVWNSFAHKECKIIKIFAAKVSLRHPFLYVCRYYVMCYCIYLSSFTRQYYNEFTLITSFVWLFRSFKVYNL